MIQVSEQRETRVLENTVVVCGYEVRGLQVSCEKSTKTNESDPSLLLHQNASSSHGNHKAPRDGYEMCAWL